MADGEPSRLSTELELLEAMYPEQTHYTPSSREFKFVDDNSHASLLVRLPETYPELGWPDVISATDAAKNDLRTRMKSAVKELRLAAGEEALDAIIAAFQQLLESAPSNPPSQNGDSAGSLDNTDASKTVIVWLHHLLNTNKRKLALSPPHSASPVSGLTKPGYPGILVYSGPFAAVTEHISTLKAQNWQAFQVRYEVEESWTFAHGHGVKEVESMSEIVKGVEIAEGTATKQKDEFIRAVGIR